jgi:hypothetical protein
MVAAWSEATLNGVMGLGIGLPPSPSLYHPKLIKTARKSKK